MSVTIILSNKFMTNTDQTRATLQKTGLNQKEISTYLALLTLGSSSVRKVAEKAGLNRGVTYESLKELQKLGLVAYYHKDKHQHFTAEVPATLLKILSRKKSEIESIEKELESVISELNQLSNKGHKRAVVKFYENYSGVRSILEDVLDSVDKLPKKEYIAYSSSAIRPFLYHKFAYPKFSEDRIKRKIFVRTIASGRGGATYGRDERKWLSLKEGDPTYKLIYAGRVAMISVDQNEMPHGLIIEDPGLYKTELSVFDALWKTL